MNDVLPLIRYKLDDPAADVRLEVEDYLRHLKTEPGANQEKTAVPGLDGQPQYYADSQEFYLSLMGAHLQLPHVLQRTALLVEVARKSQAKTFADWGAGTGRECIALARLGVQVTHLDVLGEGTRLAQWRYARRNIPVRVADVTAPPAEAYDMISSFDCLEHVGNPIDVLGEMLDHLKPGGYLFLVGDFYNFNLDQPAAPHLPKNFVYGGITQIALQKIGIQQVYGTNPPNVWRETAEARTTIWQKPSGWPPEKSAKNPLFSEIRKLLYVFREFYDREIARVDASLKE